MDCNRCNTNYNRSDYNKRNNMQSKMRGGMYSNIQNRSMLNRTDMSVGAEDDCNKMPEHVDHMNPGMSYVPWQKWEEIYDMEKGFERGTIFCQLDKPYIGRCVK